MTPKEIRTVIKNSGLNSGKCEIVNKNKEISFTFNFYIKDVVITNWDLNKVILATEVKELTTTFTKTEIERENFFVGKAGTIRIETAELED